MSTPSGPATKEHLQAGQAIRMPLLQGPTMLWPLQCLVQVSCKAAPNDACRRVLQLYIGQLLLMADGCLSL